MVNNQELTDEQLDEATGMSPLEETEVEETEIEESETEEASNTEEESEKSKEESDAEEADDESEEEEDKSKVRRTVPYGKLKAERQKRQELEESLPDKVKQGVKEALLELGKVSKEETPDAVKEAALKLGDKLGIDAEGIEEILRASTDLSKKAIPADIEEKLKKLEKLEQDSKDAKEKEYFNNEWDGVIPDIKNNYPGITDAILAEAKAKMKEISHEDKYLDKELDYILFKEKKTFDTILKVAPKDKGGEKGKEISIQAPEEGDNLVDIEDMTPEIMKAREAKELNRKPDTSYTDMQIQEPID